MGLGYVNSLGQSLSHMCLVVSRKEGNLEFDPILPNTLIPGFDQVHSIGIGYVISMGYDHSHPDVRLFLDTG